MRRHVPLAMFALLFLIGCGNSPASDPTANEAAPEQGDSTNNAPPKIDVAIKSWQETEQIIAEKKGQVVVVDFWATY